MGFEDNPRFLGREMTIAQDILILVSLGRAGLPKLCGGNRHVPVRS